MTNATQVLVEQLAERFLKASKKLVTAESCTGGGLAENLTQLPGSSLWYECGFVTCVAWCERDKGGNTTCVHFEGDRRRVREQSCLLAMQGLLDILQKTSD